MTECAARKALSEIAACSDYWGDFAREALSTPCSCPTCAKVDPFLVYLASQEGEAMRQLIAEKKSLREALATEREACAMTAETTPVREQYCVGRDLLTVEDAVGTKRDIAAAIRARK